MTFGAGAPLPTSHGDEGLTAHAPAPLPALSDSMETVGDLVAESGHRGRSPDRTPGGGKKQPGGSVRAGRGDQEHRATDPSRGPGLDMNERERGDRRTKVMTGANAPGACRRVASCLHERIVSRRYRTGAGVATGCPAALAHRNRVRRIAHSSRGVVGLPSGGAPPKTVDSQDPDGGRAALRAARATSDARYRRAPKGV